MDNNTQEEMQPSLAQPVPSPQTDTPKQNGKSRDNWQWFVVAAVVFLFTVVTVWALFFKEVPPNNTTYKPKVEPAADDYDKYDDDYDDYEYDYDDDYDDELEWLNFISDDLELSDVDDSDSDYTLQSLRNDTIRRNDMSRVDTSLVQYQTNHSNQPDNLPNPGTTAVKWEAPLDNTFGSNCSTNIACAFVRDYMNNSSLSKLNSFEDPDGVPYNVVITPNWASGENAAGASIQITGGAGSKLEKVGDGYTIRDNGGNAFDAYTIYIIPGARCVGDSATASTKRHFAIMYRLEGAGVYCIDDQ